MTSTQTQPAANRSEAASPVSADLFAFDLCVLAYQLYNQALIWPLDPFYEEWARPGSSRRDNVMAGVHRHCASPRKDIAGPGSLRGWPSNDQLDPILTDASRIDPHRGVVTNDGIHFRYLRTHDTITSSIATTSVCQYGDHRQGRPIDPALTTTRTLGSGSGSGSDHLYVFEGGTGSFDGKPHAWGPLGLVLDRAARPDDPTPTEAGSDYEIHIAFRGSQSGDAYRAAYQGFVTELGNPDWVTDMEFLKTVTDRRIATDGRVTLGLRDTVVSCFGSLVACLEHIAERRGSPPSTVHITGHSLGGALAVQLASALSIGELRATLPAGLRGWPLDTIHLTTFGAQKSGDALFARSLEPNVVGRRVWLHGDPIPEFPANEHVGTPIRLDNGRMGPVNHEPAVTRRALVDELRWQSQPLDDHVAAHVPFLQVDDLGSALHAAAEHGDELTELFTHEPAHDDTLLDIYADAISQASSYRVPWTKPPPERQRRRRRLTALFTRQASTLDELADQLADIRAVQPGSAEQYLARWYVIREARRNTWSTRELLDDERIAAALGTYRRPAIDTEPHLAVAEAVGPLPAPRDVSRVNAIISMRRVHRRTVVEGDESGYRRRVPPISGMPKLVRACSHYAGLEWLPKELMVPEKIPAEGQLPLLYKAAYYGLGKLGFTAYSKSPIAKSVPWRPSYPWNNAFPPPEDGWAEPTSDETFVQLRLQGPNPFDLRRDGDGYVLDLTDILDGVLPPIVARFDCEDGRLTPRDITIGRHLHQPGDPTWDQAKRVVNAADIRIVTFLRHLLDVHFIVGSAFALGAYNLPTWHPLRPLMHFFSYGTLQVNDFAYQAFFVPSSYFVASGFITGDAAASLFQNRIAEFDLRMWNPAKDIADRGLADIDGHAYAEDAQRTWPELVQWVERYLDALGLDDAAIQADDHLDIWFRTLGTLIPNLDARSASLDRATLVELLASFLYNNVIHEICGDLSPILRSDDPDDKAVINLDALITAVGDGRLDQPIPAPSMNDVFLMDQASDASRFNVGGNNLLSLTPARWVDEPKLADAIRDLQQTLTRLDTDLDATNDARPVRFGRMQPRHWEASISF